MAKLKHHERAYRSLVKTITYRVLITVVIFSISEFITHNTRTALQISGLSIIISTAVYYLHERIWAHVSWGRIKKS